MNYELDGRDIEYKLSGESGGWVVILQGWGTSCDIYDPIADILSVRYRVLQFDLPGFGRSEEPERAYTVADYAGAVIRFLTALGIEKAIFIGHSYGGRIIIRMAAMDDCSVTIEKIVLIDSAGVMPRRTAAQLRKQRRYKRLKKLAENRVIYSMFPDLIDDFMSRQGSEDYRRATPLMKKALVMAVNEDLCDLMPLVKPETLLIWGDNDTATPISDAKTMERLMPDASLAVIEGVGHYSFLESPMVFKAILTEFLLKKDGGEV